MHTITIHFWSLSLLLQVFGVGLLYLDVYLYTVPTTSSYRTCSNRSIGLVYFLF
jgi:hypothetical protein